MGKASGCEKLATCDNSSSTEAEKRRRRIISTALPHSGGLMGWSYKIALMPQTSLLWWASIVHGLTSLRAVTFMFSTAQCDCEVVSLCLHFTWKGKTLLMRLDVGYQWQTYICLYRLPMRTRPPISGLVLHGWVIRFSRNAVFSHTVSSFLQNIT